MYEEFIGDVKSDLDFEVKVTGPWWTLLAYSTVMGHVRHMDSITD